MRIRLTRKQRAQFPNIRLDKQTLDEMSVVAQGAIIDNIVTQKTADGGQLKVNAPSTRARKAKEGKPLLSLIDEMHRFIKKGGASWRTVRYLEGNRGVVIGPATPELSELVQVLGERGYTGYIGLQRKHIAAILAVLRKGLKRLFDRAKSGASTTSGGRIGGEI